LAHLQRGFNIAVRSRMLPEAPRFPRVKLDNARKVFIDRPTLGLLLAHLPEDVRPVFEVGLLTGWRKEAILSRERRHVDLRHRWVTLDGRWSKNGEPVTVALNRPLRAIFLRQERLARQVERATGRIIPWVFFYSRASSNNRAGDRIRDFSKMLDRARVAAGIPGVRFHDLRRGAIRTLRRAGASEHEIMEWVGLKTRAVFDRYDVIDEERRRETGAKLEAYYEAEDRRPAKVVGFRTP
jgi:integrase